MKFAIKPEDKLALVLSIVPHAVQGAERQDIRLTAWDDLGVRGFARIASQRMQKQIARFSDEEMVPFIGETSVAVELQATTVQFLIDEIGAGTPGVYADQLAEIRHDLLKLQKGAYTLPEHLQTDVKG